MSRKTVSVSEMLQFANESLACKDHSVEFKEGICSMIEKALHKSGNYKGFIFLDARAASIDFDEETQRYLPNAAYMTRKYISSNKLAAK